MNTFSELNGTELFSSSCTPCESINPFNCYGANNRSPKQGYWRYNYSSNTFLRCPNNISCLGDYNFKFI